MITWLLIHMSGCSFDKFTDTLTENPNACGAYRGLKNGTLALSYSANHGLRLSFFILGTNVLALCGLTVYF